MSAKKGGTVSSDLQTDWQESTGGGLRKRDLFSIPASIRDDFITCHRMMRALRAKEEECDVSHHYFEVGLLELLGVIKHGCYWIDN